MKDGSERGQDLPGGFECEAYKKTNFLQAAQPQWLDPARPICENCLLEAKRRAAEGMPKEPLRFTSANYADPGETLPETDALTFFEEEILSPIQHIVRIFTLHATGQCELRGHVRNLFQNGPQYVRNIPAAIGDMKNVANTSLPQRSQPEAEDPFLSVTTTSGKSSRASLPSVVSRRFVGFAGRCFDPWWLC